MTKDNLKNTQEKPPNKPSWSEVVIRLIDALYNLVNSGQVMWLVLLLLLAIPLTVVVRANPDDLGPLAIAVIGFFNSNGLYLVLIGVVIAVSFWALRRSKTVYEGRIRSLEAQVEQLESRIHALDPAISKND